MATPDDRPWRDDHRQRGTAGDQPEWEPEVWVEDPEEDHAPPKTAGRAGQRTGPGGADSAHRARPRRDVPEEVQDELHDAVGAAQRERIKRRLAEAVRAYERDRYDDALNTLRPVARLVPMSPSVRELHGLTLYRLGRWAAAVRELEAFHALTASFDQHPVLIDCHRAARRWRAAEAAWEELRKASPSPEVLAEGRIAMAGARADRGDLEGAIELLGRAPTKERPPPLHHLRQWYALADLYERAGDFPRARTLFRAVLDNDPTLFDTPHRLAALA